MFCTSYCTLEGMAFPVVVREKDSESATAKCEHFDRILCQFKSIGFDLNLAMREFCFGFRSTILPGEPPPPGQVQNIRKQIGENIS